LVPLLFEVFVIFYWAGLFLICCSTV